MKNIISLLNISILLFFSTSFCFSQAPEIEWQKSFGGSGEDKVTAVIQTTDGGFLVSGGSESIDGDVTDNKGKLNCWILKLTDKGNVDWKKCFGGETDHQANDIIETKDKFYVMAGRTMFKNGNETGSHGNDDYWVSKISPNQTLQWDKTFGGRADDNAKSIKQTADRGFIVAGWGNGTGYSMKRSLGGNDFWVMKINIHGIIKWESTYGGSGSDEATSVILTSDDGYAVTGYTSSNNFDVKGNHGGSDCWLLKLNNDGTKQWQKCFGGTSLDFAYSIYQTKDHGYIIGGTTASNDGDVKGNHGQSDGWVIKTDSTGTIVWQRCLGGKENDAINSIEQTRDGGYILAGSTNSKDGDVNGNHGSSDVWIVKLNEKGEIVWQKCLGGKDIDIASSIHQTTDGGYIIGAYSKSKDGDVNANKGNFDYWLIKLKAD